MPSARALIGLALLVATAFAVSFLLGRAVRGENRPDLRPPPVVAPAAPQLVPLGPPAVIPPLAPRTATRRSR